MNRQLVYTSFLIYVIFDIVLMISTIEITAGTGYTNGLIAAIALAICGAVISAIVVVILLTLTLRIQWSAAQRK